MRRAGRWVPYATVTALVVIGLVAVTAWLGNLAWPLREKTIDRSQPTVLKSIENLSRYHAAVGNFEVIIDEEKDISWVPDFIAGERSLFVAAGTVDAYVDFGGLAEGDLALSADGTSVTIRLPEAQLDKVNLDQERTYLFSQERGVLNRIKDAASTQDQQRLYLLAEEKIAAAARESGLTRQAEENTRAMLVGMCNALGIKASFAD